MNFAKMLEDVVRKLGAVNLGRGKNNPRLASLDRGVLTVSLLLASLDGTIMPEEYAAFEDLAGKCRGGSAKNVRELVEKALRSAGYLMALAQTGVYDEKRRLEAFVDEATSALPSGFSDGSVVDLRRAFALWVAMCVSDGTFSTLERKAIDKLIEYYMLEQHARNVGRAEAVAANVPMGVEDLRKVMDVKVVPLFEKGFIAKAERIFRDMALPAKRAQAEEVLEKLVGKAEQSR